MSSIVPGKHPSMYIGQVWETTWGRETDVFLVVAPDPDLPDREVMLLNLLSGEIDGVNIIAFSGNPCAMTWKRIA